MCVRSEGRSIDTAKYGHDITSRSDYRRIGVDTAFRNEMTAVLLGTMQLIFPCQDQWRADGQHEAYLIEMRAPKLWGCVVLSIPAYSRSTLGGYTNGAHTTRHGVS